MIAFASAPRARLLDTLTPADLGSLLLIGAVALYIEMINGQYSYDDAFITYRMADHLASGIGFVYNANEWHLSSTAALYGLLLGGLSWLLGMVSGAVSLAPPSIPALGGLVSGFALLAPGWMPYVLGRSAGAARCGLAAGLLYVTSPMIFVTFGGEMPLQIALITGSFCALRQQARVTATVLAALAIVTRPDGVLAAAVLLVYDSVTRRKLPWREMLLGAVILLPFVASGWYAYGSPLPSTLAAKLAQRDSGLWTTFGPGLVNWILLFAWNDQGPNLGFAPVAPPFLWLWTLVGTVGVWRYRVFWPLLAWVALFVLAYTAMRIPFYHWYAAPAVLGLSIVAACGLCLIADLSADLAANLAADLAADLPGRGGGAADRVARFVSTRRPLVVFAVVLLIVSVAAFKPLQALPRTSAPNATARLYVRVGQWLAANTPPASSVGYYEIGYVGFYGHRRMIDTLGLIDPEVCAAVGRRDFSWALRKKRPDYILEKRGAGLNGFLNESWFKEEYRPRAILSLRAGASEAVVVHERVASPGR